MKKCHILIYLHNSRAKILKTKILCFCFLILFLFYLFFMFFMLLFYKREHTNHINAALWCRRVGARRRLLEGLHQLCRDLCLRLAAITELLVVELQEEHIVLLLPDNGEHGGNALERPRCLARRGGRRRRAHRANRPCLIMAGRVTIVHHGDDADLVITTGLLHNVPIGVEGESVHEPDHAELVVVHPLAVRLRLLMPPLAQIPLMPDDCIAVRAVAVADRHKAHWEVLPDVLAEPQRRSLPALQCVLFCGHLHRPADAQRTRVLGRRHNITPRNIHRDFPEVVGRRKDRRHFRMKERKNDQKEGATTNKLNITPSIFSET